ncbi:GNAT family N-acetyltransferase [Algisphaera agarilytica]|uniref:N-acetyltransferase domain-containing protein n=1 Tax=Algisphaera agarilytica TaxID=1385975 RepID=A0A7X0H5Q7_9BACT|nr:GNAT family N-acetyltransferase [Algisphaera agarilytica]MBB6429773.1 hypothetical protein [Algisphaera agarilytica]
MSNVIRYQPDDSNHLPVLPTPRVEINIRSARLTDFDFIDDLQKRHKNGVGFMWEKAIKGHIEKGNVLVAEATRGTRNEVSGTSEGSTHHCSLGTHHSDQFPVGYVLGTDRYLKRDELGIIYQMNVEPEFQRSLVAANLLKAKFERSAYGCRLYCCWCAQDLPANRFWEAMGFVPLAFRTGGGRTRKAGPRMHIFWQKRIREGDTGDVANGGTAYWFPSLTGAGAIGEDRIVLPIPPGTHWSDAKPIVLPNGRTSGGRNEECEDEVKLLESEVQRLERQRKQAVKQKQATAVRNVLPTDSIESGALRFGGAAEPVEVTQAREAAAAEVDAELKAAKQKVKAAKKKFDPAQEAFARELKDRWLEQVLAEPRLLAPTQEKYNVARQIEANPPMGNLQAAQGMVRNVLEGEVEVKRLDAA